MLSKICHIFKNLIYSIYIQSIVQLFKVLDIIKNLKYTVNRLYFQERYEIRFYTYLYRVQSIDCIFQWIGNIWQEVRIRIYDAEIAAYSVLIIYVASPYNSLAYKQLNTVPCTYLVELLYSGLSHSGNFKAKLHTQCILVRPMQNCICSTAYREINNAPTGNYI